MSRCRSKPVVLVGAVVATLSLLAAACGNANDNSNASDTAATGTVTTFKGKDYSTNQPVKAPGVSSTEIRVASITSKTNPIGGENARLNDGLKAYFDMLNAKGGVWGRKINLASERDDQTGNNVSETEAMLSQDNAYAVFEAVELFTGAPKLAQAGIPTFGWNINPEWAGPKNFFPNIGPICFNGCNALGRAVPWLVEQSGAHRVAVLGYNVPQSSSSMEGAIRAIQQFGKEVDAQVVFSDLSMNFGQTDFSAQVSQMKEKKADFLVTAVDANGDYAIAKEMKKQGILDKITFLHPNLYNHEFVKKNAEVLNGGIVLVPILAAEHTPAPPVVQEYLDYAKAHDVVISEMTEQGWFAARQFVEALEATGPNFTWANLIDARNQQKWFANGGVEPPIDWSVQHNDPSKGPQYRAQFECSNYVRIENGEFKGIYDDGGKKPWVCFDGRHPDTWHEPINLSFEGEPFSWSDVANQ